MNGGAAMRKIREKTLCVLIACIMLIPLITSAGAQSERSQGAIKVDGAGSMFGRVHTLSKMFMKNQPGIEVKVKRGATVDDGIAELLDGKTDVAMASRRLTKEENQKAAEKKLELAEVLIGYGGIVIVVHPEIAVDALTLDQVKRIFKGEYTNWSEVGGSDQPVKIFRAGQTHPGTLFFMQEEFLQAPFAEQTVGLDEFVNMMRTVAKNPGSIGYVRIRDALESPSAYELNVKILGIKASSDSPAVMPSRETVKDESYPIKRPYYLYYNKKASDDVKKLVEFIMEKGWGQQTL
jgi:phosphate transport system substrate-binding protein